MATADNSPRKLDDHAAVTTTEAHQIDDDYAPSTKEETKIQFHKTTN